MSATFYVNTHDPDNKTTAVAIKSIMARLDESRILTPLRSGLTGSSGINGYLLGELGGTFDPAGSIAVFSGAPVIIKKNDYTKELFNGDVGL
ncbi:MAG: hypothetical protein HGA52_01610, partial [Bacteroidales bacterium]|nr:hypothetical protein [Bacteroidales bacterium]